MRERPNISEDHLRACLQEQYGLFPVTLEFLPLGLDTRAGTYRVVSEHGTPYFLKAKAGSLYQAGCLVPGYLRDQGITAVVAPLPTKSHTLWTQVGEWTVIVYPFIDGDSDFHMDMTAENWQEVGTILKQIHQVVLPAEGFQSLRKETFDPTEYSRWVSAFEMGLGNSETSLGNSETSLGNSETSLTGVEAQQAHMFGGSRTERALRSYWLTHQSTIHAAVASLAKLAPLLQKQAEPQVICHADLHPNNMVRDNAGHMFVIDWDDVMLAPKERDFLFVREAQGDGSALQDTSPFFQGYGQTEINWVALTYYRWERVVQDLIECAQQVLFRPDLGEEIKEDAVQLFRDILAGGGMVEAARAAATHL